MEKENEQYDELSTDGWIVKHRPTLNTNVLNEQGRFDPVKAMFDTSDDITYFIACPRIVDEEFSDVNKLKKWPLSFDLRYIVQTKSLPTCDLGMYLSRIEDFGEPYYVLDLFEESELEKNPILKEQFKDVPLPTDPFLPYNCSGFIAALINLARNYKYYRLAQFASNPHCPIRLSELDFYLFDIYPEFYQAYYDHVWSYYRQIYHYVKPESINDDGVDPYIRSTEKLFYDDFTNSLIYNEFSENQRKRIQKYFNAFMLFLKNRIGYDLEEQETEQKEELPQPEPEQHKEDSCCYINREQILKNGIYTLQQFENLLRQAAENDAPSLVKFLKKYLSTGDLDFHGDSRTKIHRNLQEHFPSMRKYSDRNFTEACNKGDFSPFPLKKAEK